MDDAQDYKPFLHEKISFPFIQNKFIVFPKFPFYSISQNQSVKLFKLHNRKNSY